MQFLYQAPIGLVQTTLAGEITMINPMSSQLLMPLAPDGNLLNLFDVLAPVAPQLRALAAQTASADGVVCENLRVAMPAASARAGAPAQTLALRMVRLDDCTLMACLADVTDAVAQEQARLATTLRAAARIDALTRLPTRAVVLERIARALQRAGRDGSDGAGAFAVLFINADRFNRINVTLGQAAGDNLLRLMAERLNGTVRQHDTLGTGDPPQRTAGRLGGNEFVVVLEGLRSTGDLPAIAQRLVDTLNRPYALGGNAVHLSASIGVVGCDARIGAVADAAGDDGAAAVAAESLLQDASLAMRDAKRGGGGRYCVFEPAMKERAWRRGSLEDALRLAITDGQLFVVYQPIVDLGGDEATGTAGVEALVRWRHPQRGIVPPIEFIEIAEETGLIGALGAFVLDTACRQLVAWQRQLGAAAPRLMSVNLSRAQLAEPTIAAQVAAALAASGLAPACLQLEVTESMAAQDQDLQSRLHALKALGLSLALDDFGTGYSSLSSLHQLPIDVVKIDRSFVCQAETSAHHRVLIEATVRVARSLGMRTVAEGIETAGQAAVLAALQCDKGQGYLYARPLAADDATAWLRQAAARDEPVRLTAA